METKIPQQKRYIDMNVKYIYKLHDFKNTNLTPEIVLRETSKFLNISVEEIIIPRHVPGSKVTELVYPRHLVCFIMKHALASYSLKKIGESINRDHASVLHACKTISNRIDTNYQSTISDLDILIRRLKNNTVCFQSFKGHSLSTDRVLLVNEKYIITNNAQFV